MGLYKNVASQKIAVYAYDTSADGPKTGDAADITAQISKDFGAAAATNDTNPTELDATDHPGVYVFDLTQSETNADNILITAVSATANIILDPVQVFTVPPNFRALGIESDGHAHADVKEIEGSDATDQINAACDTALTDYGAAQPGDQMDIVNAPNNTALTAIGAKLEAMILDEGDATALLAAISAKVEEFLINEGDATATLAAIAAAVTTAIGDGSALTEAGGTGDHLTALATAANQTTILDKLLGYFQLALRSDSFIETDRAVELAEINANEGSGGGFYSSVLHSQEDIYAGIESNTLTLLSSISTVLSRLGAFTGSGANTALGFLRAIMRKDVTTPTDVGGTFSAATDSLEAIRDRGDAAWTGGGGGGGGSGIPVRTAISPGDVVSEKIVAHYKIGRTFAFTPTDDEGEAVVPDGTYRFCVAEKGSPDAPIIEIDGIDTLTATQVLVTLTGGDEGHTSTITDDGSGKVYLYTLKGEQSQGLVASNVYVCREVPV